MEDEYTELDQDKEIVIIAHRGKGPTSHFSGACINPALLQQPEEPRDIPAEHSPENTINAFNVGLNEGADGIELDVFLSKDNIPMVIHDNELNKNVRGAIREALAGQSGYIGLVSDYTAEELQRYNVGQNQGMPTLEQVIQLVVGTQKILNIEFKSDGDVVYRTHSIILQYTRDGRLNQNQVVYCSFDHNSLRSVCEFHTSNNGGDGFPKIAPAIRTAVLFGQENVRMPGWFVRPGIPYTQKCKIYLEILVTNRLLQNRITAYDVVLWDVDYPLIKLAERNTIGIHVSTSNFRIFHSDSPFLEWLILINNKFRNAHNRVYFKTDEPRKINGLLYEAGSIATPDLEEDADYTVHDNQATHLEEEQINRLVRPQAEVITPLHELLNPWPVERLLIANCAMVYNNPLLNHLKQQEILQLAYKNGGTKLLNQIISIGLDMYKYYNFLDNIKSFGIEKSVQLVMFEKMDIGFVKNLEFSGDNQDQKANNFFNNAKWLVLLQVAERYLERKNIQLLVELGEDKSIAEQMIVAVDKYGIERVLEILFNKKYIETQNVNELSDQTLKAVEMIKCLIDEKELSELIGFDQYISSALSNDVFSSAARKIIYYVSNLIQSFEKYLNIESIYESSDINNQVIIILTQLEHILGFMASGNQIFAGVYLPMYSNSDPDYNGYQGGRYDDEKRGVNYEEENYNELSGLFQLNETFNTTMW